MLIVTLVVMLYPRPASAGQAEDRQEALRTGDRQAYSAMLSIRSGAQTFGAELEDRESELISPWTESDIGEEFVSSSMSGTEKHLGFEIEVRSPHARRHDGAGLAEVFHARLKVSAPPDVKSARWGLIAAAVAVMLLCAVAFWARRASKRSAVVYIGTPADRAGR